MGLWLVVMGVCLGTFWALRGASWGPPGGLLGRPGGLLGYSWGPLGCLVAPSPILGRLLGPLWGPNLVKFGLDFCFQFEHRDGFVFIAHLGTSGGRLGPDFGPVLVSMLGSPGERLDF